MLPSAIIAVLSLCVLATVLAGRSVARNSGAAACLIAALAIAFQRELSPFTRGLLTFPCLISALKCVQIATSDPAQWTLPRRVWSALVFFDVRDARRAAWAWDGVMLAKVALFPILLVAAVWLPLRFSGRLSSEAALAMKLICGAVFAYVVLDFGIQVMRAAHRLLGFDTGPLHRDPVFSRTLSEFWGERWNLPVTKWLNEYCFRPCARRGNAAAGLVAAFAMSALLRFWLFFAAVNLVCGLLAGVFFLLQVPALLWERRWRVRRWPAFAARAWTIGFLLATSPLLTIPMIVGLEMQLQHR